MSEMKSLNGIEKILNRAITVFYILCGFGGASVTLAIICALGKVEAVWLLMPTIPFLLIGVYHWGLLDAVNEIIGEWEETK